MKTNIRRKTIQSFCRTCLAEIAKYSVGKGQKFNIHKTVDLAKWIKETTQLNVERNDEYPNYMCQNCYKKLLSFSEFRETCIRSMHILDRILGKNKSDAQGFTAEEVIVTKIELCEHEIQKVEETDWLSYDAKNDIVAGADENAELNKIMASAKFENPEHSDDMCYINETEQVKDDDKMMISLESDATFEYKNCSAEATSFDVDIHIKTGNFSSEHAIEDCSEKESESSASFLNDINPKRKKRLGSQIVKNQESEDCVKSPAKRFVCEFCQRRCISEQNLAAHLRIHQGLRPHQCNQCERSFNRASRLKAHIQETHRADVEMIKCSFEGCDKEYRRADTVRTHYRLKHTGIQKPIIKRSYMCEDCGRTFNNVTILKEHRYTHRPTEEYPYKCDLCEKRYISQRTFKEHQMRHKGIKNYECPYCGMRKTTRSELLTHVNYHTKEKQWPCPSCPSVFNSSANLGLHNRIVHKGIRAYSCRYCEQSFGKAETLKHHEMRHTGEKPHECQTCGKRFIQAVALRAHLKTHNKMEGDVAKKQQSSQCKV